MLRAVCLHNYAASACGVGILLLDICGDGRRVFCPERYGVTMLLTNRERAIQRVYEAAANALKQRRDRKEITDEAFLAGTRQLYNHYQKDLDAEFYAENTWENGRLAL